jgi:hypothetical protein
MFVAVAVAAVGVVVGLAACPAPTEITRCEGGCAQREPACDGCPAVADELCVDGECVAVVDKDATVIADVSIARGVDGVDAVTIAIVDTAVACADLGDLTAAAGVFAGTRIDVSGGPFHPDLNFGTAPAGAVLVAADGLNAAGDIVGRGCVAVDLVAGDNDVGVITVAADGG